MNIVYIILLLPFLVFAKSKLDFTIVDPSIPPMEDLLQPLENDLRLGDGKVLVNIFDSYSCIHCKKFYDEIFPILQEKFIKNNKITFIHKEFPIDARAIFGVKIVHCSKSRFDAIQKIYKNQEILLENKDYQNIFKKMFNVTDECIAQFDESAFMKKAFEYSKGLGIRGTPTVFIDGKKFEKLNKQNLIEHLENLTK